MCIVKSVSDQEEVNEYAEAHCNDGGQYVHAPLSASHLSLYFLRSLLHLVGCADQLFRLLLCLLYQLASFQSQLQVLNKHLPCFVDRLPEYANLRSIRGVVVPLRNESVHLTRVLLERYLSVA